MSLTIGVDVGGTKVAAGVVDDHGRILETLRRATPAASPERTAAAIADVVTELLGRHQASAVGVGAARFVDEAGGTVAFAPNLAWRGEPLRTKVAGLVGLRSPWKTTATLARGRSSGSCRPRPRARHVRLRRHRHRGRFHPGRQALRGRWGMAGEPGQLRVVPDGRLCGCGNRGCWEQYASGSALMTKARDLAMRAPGGAMRLLQLAGGDTAAIGGPQVTRGRWRARTRRRSTLRTRARPAAASRAMRRSTC